MDPNNNNQPINTNPLGQAAGSQSGSPAPSITVPPAQTEVPAPVTPAATPPTPTPKSGGKKIIALLIILLVLALGMGGYVLFAKNQLSKKQKTALENTSVIIPTATIVPTVTLANIDELDVASPDAELKDIENDLQGL